MPVIEITSLQEPGIEIYTSLTEQQLRKAGNCNGFFIAESPKVIATALEAGYEPVSLLCEKRHIVGDAADIISQCGNIPVYTGQREILAQLTGYTLTRGVLCAMQRKQERQSIDICQSARRIAVIEAVCDTTNIGAIFRSAAALGFDGILLTPDACDPLNRRSLRVSMGTVLKIPWAVDSNPVTLLKEHGFTTLAMTLQPDSLPINAPCFKTIDKIAVVLGTEGDGLTQHIISQCDYKVIIPMHRSVDSLNVGMAAAIAFWEFGDKYTDLL